MIKKRNYYIVSMVNSDNIKNLLGTNLKKLRSEKGLTQEQLAECLDLQVQTISFIENGRTFVSGDVFAKICNFFDVSPEFMFKPKFIEKVGKTETLKKELIQMISDCDAKLLTKYINILIALKN